MLMRLIYITRGFKMANYTKVTKWGSLHEIETNVNLTVQPNERFEVAFGTTFSNSDRNLSIMNLQYT